MSEVVYKVSYCKEDPDVNPNREWIYNSRYFTLNKAIGLAQKLSNEEDVFEVEIRGENTKTGETEHHSFWRNGELEIDMKP